MYDEQRQSEGKKGDEKSRTGRLAAAYPEKPTAYPPERTRCEKRLLVWVGGCYTDTNTCVGLFARGFSSEMNSKRAPLF